MSDQERKTPSSEDPFVSKGRRSPWAFFISNFRLTYLLIIGIIIFGIFAIVTIPKESAPEVDIPTVVVTTTLPGASAVDVEQLVTNELESAVQGLDGLDSLSSVSSQGFSQITINFEPDVDGREKLTDTRDQIEGVSAELPDDAGDPRVQKVSFSDVPIMTLAVSGPYQAPQLKRYADDLQDQIEGISDVSEVDVTGAPERIVKVRLNQAKLNQFGLSVSQVSQAISSANSDLPIGALQTAGTNYTVRFAGRLAEAEDVRNTTIATVGGSPVFVRDIAEVNDTFSDPSTITRSGGYENPADTSVGISIFKTSGQGDILNIAEEVHSITSQAEQNELPENVDIAVTRSDAEVIQSDLTTLISSGAVTVLILLGVLVLFLGFRAAILASLVAPLTFLITLGLLAPLGYTINFLTLFSLILALGILVDAAIVVVESVFRKRADGENTTIAVLATIGQFQKPLIAGTLTTVFVFAPMLLMGGIIGKFIESIPVTITIVLLAAIFIALAVLTTLATRFFASFKKQQTGVSEKTQRNFLAPVFRWYERRLSALLARRRSGRLLLGVFAVLFVLAVLLPVVGLVKVNMFPPADSPLIFVDVENPVGTPLSVTSRQLATLESEIEDDVFVDTFLSTAGAASNAGSIAAGSNSSHIGNIAINLSDEDRPGSLEIVEQYEDELSGLVAADVEVSQPQGGPPSGAPVQVELRGSDLRQLDSTAREVADELRAIDGVRNVDNGIEEGAGEFTVTVDRAKAQNYGVSPAQVAQVLRTALSGTQATVIKSGGNDIDVDLSFAITGRQQTPGAVPALSVSELQAIPVASSRGLVPVSTFTDISLESSRSSISHEDGDRITTVSAETAPEANAGVIVSTLQERMDFSSLPEGVSVSFGGQQEDIAESFASLGQAMLIGILAIFSLLIWQFRSYRQPLFVLSTIPLALIGVLPGLALIGASFSFPGFIGLVALSGVVVNNAIIMIDAINGVRAEGRSVDEAVQEAALSRFRPVVLTTLSTVLAMIPLALSDPMWAPLAYSIIFGLSFSSISTLFVVPVLYQKFMRREFFKGDQ